MDEGVIVLTDSEPEPVSRSPSPKIGLNLDLSLDLPAINFNHVPRTARAVSPESDTSNFNYVPRTVRAISPELAPVLPRIDSGFCSQPIDEPPKPREKKTRKPRAEKPDVQQRKLAAEEKRRKAEKEKLLKQVEKKNKQSQKREEALKYCRAKVDEFFRDRDLLDVIIKVMVENEATYSVTNNCVPYSVCWERETELHFLDDDDVLQVDRTRIPEKQMLVVWSWREVVEMISLGTFRDSVEELHTKNPHMRITLLVEGMEKYFAYQKGKGRKKDYGRDFTQAPKINKMDLEEELVEIQLMFGCNSQLVEDFEHVALTVFQFTKSIALIPFKEDKWKKLEDVDTFVIGDKKDTVIVNKEGLGLKKLWQKQLCQFNLASLETAEAICTVYPSPVQLMEAYLNCTDSEGEMLLKDIPIRRAAGPLNCVRKIGPELSKKIYLMFTSEDGDVLLGNA